MSIIEVLQKQKANILKHAEEALKDLETARQVNLEFVTQYALVHQIWLDLIEDTQELIDCKEQKLTTATDQTIIESFQDAFYKVQDKIESIMKGNGGKTGQDGEKQSGNINEEVEGNVEENAEENAEENMVEGAEENVKEAEKEIKIGDTVSPGVETETNASEMSSVKG
ncbi:hypothetical protein EJ08DRAFT_698071 [Tothia fuscella]|uniref:Uncharacterized protein n=1 Tax=Tothia fuscella TaxID=1048955 RepID=A0A9P4NQE4_9PEZI|nr:hypothetical protein EJ08DRAFT_698071 [Tothia fuscella]